MLDDSTILATLADEFTTRVRAGELPAIEDYATGHPHLADRIRALFPTLLLLEGMARGGGGELATGVELPPGTPFGPYTILGEIGRGGMGIVYEAMHQTLQRRVALKVLPLAGPQAATQLERFLREARTAAGLHHTHIVPVFDVGQVNGVPYFAMQRIHGRGLDAVLNDRAASTSTDYHWVAELGVQAAEALDHAHQRGVVHRDIKPSNLLLDEEGVLWVTDFGLARSDGDASLTHTGQLVGTPRYMSPEQAGAAIQPIDHRTDLYSLGATLYELLTRRPPIPGTTPQEVLQSLLQREPIAPRRLDRKIPRDLETIVLKAMSRRPEDRYASAQALADDLRRYLDHRPLSARRIGIVGRSVRWVKRNPLVAGMAAALLLCLLTVVTISSQHAIQAQREMMRARAAEEAARHAMMQAAENKARQEQQEAWRMIDQGLTCAARDELIPALHWFAQPLIQRLFLNAAEERMARQRLATFDRYGKGKDPATVPEGRPFLGVGRAQRVAKAFIFPNGERVLVFHHPEADEANLPRLDLCEVTSKVIRTFAFDADQTSWQTTRDGRYLATFDARMSSITLHDTTTGEILGRVKRPAAPGAVRLCLSEDGQTLFRLPHASKEIEVIEVPTGRVIRTLRLAGKGEAGFDLALSKDGQWIASLLGGRLQMWDAKSGEELWLREVPDAIALWFDPSISTIPGLGGGQGLVLAERHGLRLWDYGVGEPASMPLPGTSHSRVATWDGTSQRMALIDQKTVVVWETGEARPLTPPLVHPQMVRAARLSADGLSLTTVDSLGSLRLWDLSPDLTPAEDLAAGLEKRHGFRMEGGGRLVPIPDREK